MGRRVIPQPDARAASCHPSAAGFDGSGGTVAVDEGIDDDHDASLSLRRMGQMLTCSA
jgi:hypothetical protein